MTVLVDDNGDMLSFSKEKLNAVALQKGLSLSQIAKMSGISRQSLYAMMHGESVFNKPFSKLITTLGIDFQDITEDKPNSETIYQEAPHSIQHVIRQLIEFCRTNNASLFLFGSRARGKKGTRSDWDFGIHFHGMVKSKELRHLKYQLTEEAFPYRMDLVAVNEAPEWLQKTIAKEHLLLYGEKQWSN